MRRLPSFRHPGASGAAAQTPGPGARERDPVGAPLLAAAMPETPDISDTADERVVREKAPAPPGEADATAPASEKAEPTPVY